MKQSNTQKVQNAVLSAPYLLPLYKSTKNGVGMNRSDTQRTISRMLPYRTSFEIEVINNTPFVPLKMLEFKKKHTDNCFNNAVKVQELLLKIKGNNRTPTDDDLNNLFELCSKIRMRVGSLSNLLNTNDYRTKIKRKDLIDITIDYIYQDFVDIVSFISTNVINDLLDSHLPRREILRVLDFVKSDNSYSTTEVRLSFNYHQLLNLYNILDLIQQKAVINDIGGVHIHVDIESLIIDIVNHYKLDLNQHSNNYHENRKKIANIIVKALHNINALDRLDEVAQYKGNFNHNHIYPNNTEITSSAAWIRVWNNYKTIEFRTFASTLDYETLIKYSIFCNKLVKEVNNIVHKQLR
jgi:hypothetical protein